MMALNLRLTRLAPRRKTMDVAATANVSPWVSWTLCTKSSMISCNRSLRPILILNTSLICDEPMTMAAADVNPLSTG